MAGTALLVIDAQQIYTSKQSDLYCPDSKATIKKINSLIDHFANERGLIVFVRHVHKQDGSDLGRMFDFLGEPEPEFNFKEGSAEVEYDAQLNIPENAVHIVKTRYSAFLGTGLDQLLRNHGIDTIVVCGFMTNFCCDSTARHAHDLDYYVDFVVDATGTPGTESIKEPEIRKVVGELLGAGFARVCRAQSLLKRAARA